MKCLNFFAASGVKRNVKILSSEAVNLQVPEVNFLVQLSSCADCLIRLKEGLNFSTNA